MGLIKLAPHGYRSSLDGNGLKMLDFKERSIRPSSFSLSSILRRRKVPSVSLLRLKQEKLKLNRFITGLFFLTGKR